MFGKLLLNKIELDFVTMQHAAYFLIFLKSLKFLKTKVFLEIQRQYFEILVMKKHWEQSGFMPSPSYFFQNTFFCFRNFMFCQNANLVQSRVSCAIINKLPNLFDFAVHCKHSCYGWKWHFFSKKALHNREKHS